MSEQFQATANCVIVKIYNADKDLKVTTNAGLYRINTHRPMMNSCQVGRVIAFGKEILDVKIGDTILFHHSIEDMPERLMQTDAEGEYRFLFSTIMNNEIYGVVRTKNGISNLIPKRNYVVAEPTEDDQDIMTQSVFQIPISAINSRDAVAQKFGLHVADWIVCIPYGAYEIEINRKVFWFIHLENILAINKGFHKLSVLRKRVSKNLRLSTSETLTELN